MEIGNFKEERSFRAGQITGANIYEEPKIQSNPIDTFEGCINILCSKYMLSVGSCMYVFGEGREGRSISLLLIAKKDLVHFLLT